MNVVTVSREFGTGGKEFGRKLAESLGYVYLDKNIAHELAGKLNMNEQYIDYFLDTGAPIGMSGNLEGNMAAYTPAETQNNITLQIESQKMLKEMASKKDIVIIGRAADIILAEFRPFRIFIYADQGQKIVHYKNTNKEVADSTDQEIAKMLHMVDVERYQHHMLFSPIKWGDKQAYDLCINATNINIDKVAPVIAEYAKLFFEQ